MTDPMPVDIAEEEPVDIFSLPDHIIIHTFGAFSSDLDVLGRCRQVSKRFGALAADEALWRSACDDNFGLTEAVGPDGAACDSFYAAARVWSCFVTQELGTKGWLGIAPVYIRARDTWARLAAWSARELPGASQSIGPPASHGDWVRFCRWLDLDPDIANSIGLEDLRLLAAIHDGQRLPSDAQMALRQVRGRDYAFESELEQLSTSQNAGPGSHPTEHFCGLLGGFSAYDTVLSVRLFPLLLIAAWTKFFRDDYGLPTNYLVVAGSWNMQRFMLLRTTRE